MEFYDKIQGTMSFLLYHLEDGFKSLDKGLKELFEEKDHRLQSDFGEAGEVISTRNNGKGICVDGKKSISREMCYSGVAVFGATGTGKGIYTLTPTLLRIDNASVLIHDPSGTEWKNTSGYFKQKGYEVDVIDFANADSSNFYNPLLNIKTDTQIANLAHVLTRTSMGNPSDPFWNISTETLLFILIKLTTLMPTEYKHLPNVLHLLEHLSHSPEKFDRFVVKYVDSEKLMSKYKSFIVQSEKMNSSIIANTRATLKMFEDENLSKVMSGINSIDFTKLRKQKTAIFIKNNIAYQSLYGPASSILFNQLFEFVFSCLPKEDDLPIFLMLDEMSSLYINDFSNYLANVRKHKCSVTHYWQSPSSIKEKYKDQSGAIMANSRTQVFIPAGMDQNSATELSTRMGDYEWEDEKGRRSKRRLLHSTELIQYPKNEGLLLMANHPAIKLNMQAFFENFYLKSKAKLPSVRVQSKAEINEIHLFDFNSIQ